MPSTAKTLRITRNKKQMLKGKSGVGERKADTVVGGQRDLEIAKDVNKDTKGTYKWHL